MARGAFAQVHLKHQLDPFMDQEALFMVIDALVALNYCIVLYLGLSLKIIQKLQLTLQFWHFSIHSNNTTAPQATLSHSRLPNPIYDAGYHQIMPYMA